MIVNVDHQHPAYGGRPHALEIEVAPRAGRSAIVATCSCLGWHASVLVAPGRAEARELAEARERWAEHVAALDGTPVVHDLTDWRSTAPAEEPAS